MSAAEREPYISKDLPNQGYIHELVTEAFKRVGYNAVIKFYPLAVNAFHLAISRKSENYKQKLSDFNQGLQAVADDGTLKKYIRLVAQNEGWNSVPPGTRISTYKNKNYQSVAPFADFVLSAIQNADPADNTLKQSLYNGIQFVGIPEYPSLGHNVGREIQNVLEGKITVSEALENSQKLVSDQ
ncbi:MAG: hypothetical protein ABIJ59_12950, partial [Pseudomonadota bacterium]